MRVLLVCSILLIACAAEAGEPPRRVRKNPCDFSPEEWQRRFDINLRVPSLANAQMFKELLRACGKRPSAPASLSVCTQNLNAWIDAHVRHADNKLLSGLPKYVADQNPDMGRLPAFFPDNRLFPNWRKKFDECQADPDASAKDPQCASIKDAVIFDYLHSGIGAARAMQVTLIFVPGADYDKFLVFPSSDMHDGTFNVDMFTVQKRDPKTGEPLREKVAMPFEAMGKAALHPMTRTSSSRSCVGCHPNGPRPIYAIPGSIRPEELEKHALVNRAIAGYGRVGYEPFFNVRHLGPAIGKNQSCVQCHNDGGPNVDLKNPSRSQMSPLMNTSQLFGKMTSKGFFSMPPHLANHHELRNYRKAISLADKLPDKDRKELVDFARSKADGVQGRIHLYEDSWMDRIENREVNLDAANEGDRDWQLRLFDLLRKRQLITYEEWRAAHVEFGRFEREMRERYRNLIKDYDGELSLWLRGGTENCILNPPEVENSPGAHPALSGVSGN